MKTFLAVIGGIVGFVALFVLCTVLNGWVLTKMWSWFVVPVFGLPQLSIAFAIGISMLITYMTYQLDAVCKYKPDDSGTASTIVSGIMTAILRPLIVLFFAWIIHLFC